MTKIFCGNNKNNGLMDKKSLTAASIRDRVICSKSDGGAYV
ncbi:MAG: hypothetical protein ACLFMZ_03125 [Spirochaetaceae bacterium]